MKEKIIQLTKYHKIHSLYVGNKIPTLKLENAIQNFPVPNNEEIFALYDSTVFGSCKLGLAIGENGIYWKNDSYVKSNKNRLSWDEFLDCSLYNGDKSNYIEFSEGAIFNSVIDGDKMLSFLEELKDLVHSEYDEEEYDEDEEEYDEDEEEYDEDELLEEAIYNCLEKYNIPRLLYDEKLKKVNFRELVIEFYVPESDDLYAFFDSTVFGGCGNGMAITSSGLYWKNQWDKPGFLTWDSFYKADIRPKDDSILEMGNGKEFNSYAQMKNADFFYFLMDLKIEMINNIKPTVNNAFLRYFNNSEFEGYVGGIKNGKYHGKGTLFRGIEEKEGVFENGELVFDSRLNKKINISEENLFGKIKKENLDISYTLYNGESLFMENFGIKQEMLLSVQLIINKFTIEQFGSYALRFIYNPNDEWNLQTAGFYIGLNDFMKNFPKLLEWNDTGIKNNVSSKIIKPLFSSECLITSHKYTLEKEKYEFSTLGFNFYFSGVESGESFFGLSNSKAVLQTSEGESIVLEAFLIDQDILNLLPNEKDAYNLVMQIIENKTKEKEKEKSEYDLFK